MNFSTELFLPHFCSGEVSGFERKYRIHFISHFLSDSTKLRIKTTDNRNLTEKIGGNRCLTEESDCKLIIDRKNKTKTLRC